MKKIQGDIEILIVPLGIIFMVIVLMIISIKIIFDKISALNQELSDNQKTENMLKLKLTSLQAVDPALVNQSEISTLALPGSNSALDAVSQIRNQAKITNVVISNLSSNNLGSPPGTNVNSTELNFNADGNFIDIANFINKIKNSTPINRFDTIKISSQNSISNSSYRLSAIMFVFWSPLPKTIPAITEPLEKLDPEETKVLSQISILQRPTTNGSAPSSVGVGKTNPFQ
jgi:hypothetical protein